MNDVDPIFLLWLHAKLFIDINFKIDIGKLKITNGATRLISIFGLVWEWRIYVIQRLYLQMVIQIT